MSTKRKCLEVRSGDVVTICFRHGQDKGPFDAKVLAVHDRGPVNPLIDFERLDGKPLYSHIKDTPSCDASFVTGIVTRAPYKSERTYVNIFAGKHAARNRSLGGVKYGNFEWLVREALASIKHVSLLYPLNVDRAQQLYANQSLLGLVALPDHADVPWYMHRAGAVAVNWKTFKKWVRANASRLIETKAENHKRIREHNKRQSDELMRDLMHDDYLNDLDAFDNVFAGSEPDWDAHDQM